METHLLKRNLSGLLSMTNNLPRLIEEMEKILVQLKPGKHESILSEVISKLQDKNYQMEDWSYRNDLAIEIVQALKYNKE